MKKIFTGIIALAAAISFTGCDKCGDGTCTTAANDSLSTAYGNYVGSMVQSDINRMGNSTKADKETFLRGMQIVLGADNSEQTQIGMQVALQLTREIEQMKEQGIEVDRVAVMNAFKKAFLADSVNFVAIQEASANFRGLYEKAVEEARQRKEAEKSQEPEAVQNGMKAEQYIADLKASNPNAKTTENGLTYVISEEGEGAHPTANATVEVNYTGKLINGTVFDSTEGRGPATFPLQGVVPGFREGLMLLGKGGKATLYIPGKLAYGVQGQPAAGIGPNEMLIFDVELLNITE